MKAQINGDGELILEAESGLEDFVVRMWLHGLCPFLVRSEACSAGHMMLVLGWQPSEVGNVEASKTGYWEDSAGKHFLCTEHWPSVTGKEVKTTSQQLSDNAAIGEVTIEHPPTAP